MLVKLLPDQIARYWEGIWPAIDAALPPLADGEKYDREEWVLSRLLADHMQCWVSQTKNSAGQNIILAIGTTTILEDLCTKTKSLLVYSVYAFPGASTKTWKEAYVTVVKWAKAQGCTKFVGYTSNPRIEEILVALGAELCTFATINI